MRFSARLAGAVGVNVIGCILGNGDCECVALVVASGCQAGAYWGGSAGTEDGVADLVDSEEASMVA